MRLGRLVASIESMQEMPGAPGEEDLNPPQDNLFDPSLHAWLAGAGGPELDPAFFVDFSERDIRTEASQ